MPETRSTFEGWAILELMGHRRLGGYIREEQLAGAAFVRIDVPRPLAEAEAPSVAYEVEATQFYAPAAIYCITPTTEAMARAAAGTVAPVAEWELRRALPAPARTIEDDIEEHIAEIGLEEDDEIDLDDLDDEHAISGF